MEPTEPTDTHEPKEPTETARATQASPPPPPPAQRATQPAAASGVGPKNPWLAGVLSLFPGLGNVYNGLYLRAVTFFVLVVLFIYLSDRGHALWGFAVAFIWLFNVVDAYRQAVLINHGYADDPALARRLRGKTAVREKLFGGTALLVIGLLELIDRFFPLYLDWVFDLWPVIFIAIGGWLIWKAVQARRQGGGEEGAGYGGNHPSTGDEPL